MTTNATWTVIFEDKMIIKNNGPELGIGYVINDDVFWEQSKYSNIWAIQYGTTPSSDEVEYKDGSNHSSYVEANLGAFQDFITKWDSAHLSQLQSDWDSNNEQVEDLENPGTSRNETESEKIARLGARPTSYSSN